MSAPGSAPLGPAAVAAVARRPDLWATAAAVAWATAAPGWWRRWPPRPWPPEGYARFRSQSMYGGDGRRRLGGEDAVRYLEWCRRQRRHRR